MPLVGLEILNFLVKLLNITKLKQGEIIKGDSIVKMLDIVIEHKADTMLSLQTTRCKDGVA